MANETRPRRETSGTSRIRKTSPRRPLRPTSDETAGPPSAPPPTYPGTGRSTVAGSSSRPTAIATDREPYREEGPADREPIRFIREREPRARTGATEREPGMSVRERLARDRAERDGGPTHHDGIPVDRDRDRDRDSRAGGPRPRSATPRPLADFRDRPDRDSSIQFPRSRLLAAAAPGRASRDSRLQRRSSPPRSFPTSRTRTSSATPRSTTATRTSSAARSISPSCRR